MGVCRRLSSKFKYSCADVYPGFHSRFNGGGGHIAQRGMVGECIGFHCRSAYLQASHNCSHQDRALFIFSIENIISLLQMGVLPETLNIMKPRTTP